MGEAQEVPTIPVADAGPELIVAGPLIEVEVAVVVDLLCEIATAANEPAINENAANRIAALRQLVVLIKSNGARAGRAELQRETESKAIPVFPGNDMIGF